VTREDDVSKDSVTNWRADQSSVRLRPVFPPVFGESDSSSAISTRGAHALETVARGSENVGSFGSYRIVCKLAAGGMGSVYLAFQADARSFEKFSAIKFLHPHLAGHPDLAQTFVNEARFASAISHPNVCRVFECGYAGENYFIAMEYLRGKPLSTVIREASQREHALSSLRHPRIIARLIAELAEGLDAVHSLKDEHGKALELVHQDVTPHNLFVLFDGTVRVTDLGIARARECLSETRDVIKGKLRYMAPEQLRGAPLDLRADTWSLGVVLWELLTLHRLFRGSSDGETVLAVTSRAIPVPSTLNCHVPRALDDIVMKALQREPDERYQTAREFARDLNAFLAASADPISKTEIAHWMAELFPHQAQEDERLLTLGRNTLAAVRLANAEEHKLRRTQRLDVLLKLSCMLMLLLTAFAIYQLVF
jgi:serine/threonine-protein kinase